MRRFAPIVLAAMLATTACSTTGSGDSSEGGGSGGGDQGNGTFLIGFPADLSDIYAYYDQPMLEGAQMAVDELNEAGGVAGYTFELKAIDMRNDVAEASRVTQQLIDEGADYLIGTTGDGFLASASVACAAGVPISTGDGTSPTLVGDAGDCAFQWVMSDNVQGATLAEQALSLGYSNAYVVGSSEIPYTSNLPRYFSEAFEQGGGTVVGTDEYQIGAADYSALVTKIGNEDTAPDVIFTPMFLPDTPVFLRQLRQAAIDIAVMSTDGNLDPSLADAGAQALDGFTFTASVCPASEDPAIQDFFDRYEARYGSAPSSEVSALGYDEIQAVAKALETAGSSDGAALISAIGSVSYDGLTGSIQMDATTRRAQKSASVVKMEGDSFTCLGQPGYPAYVPEP